MKNFKLLKKRFTTKGKEQKYSDNKSKTKQIKVTQTIKLEKKTYRGYGLRVWVVEKKTKITEKKAWISFIQEFLFEKI